jgi:ferredoxin
MAYKISKDACTNCGSCVSSCSFDAISEKGGAHVIDADVCVDCSACVDECPTKAIVAG